MRFTKSLALGAAVAALLAGGDLAVAQPVPPLPAPPTGGGVPPGAGPDHERHERASRFIEHLDIDKDGKLSQAEIAGEQNRTFAYADVNGDGKLDAEEFRRRGMMFMRMRTTTLFDLMDANADGALTKEEIAAPSSRWFARYDANKDGAIAAEELPQRSGRGMMRDRR